MSPALVPDRHPPGLVVLARTGGPCPVAACADELVGSGNSLRALREITSATAAGVSTATTDRRLEWCIGGIDGDLLASPRESCRELVKDPIHGWPAQSGSPCHGCNL